MPWVLDFACPGCPFQPPWVTFGLGAGDSLGSLQPVPEVGLLLAEAAGTGGLRGQAQGCGAPGSFILLLPSLWDTNRGSCVPRPAPGSCRMQFCVNAAFGVLGRLQSHSGIQACCSRCRLILQL